MVEEEVRILEINKKSFIKKLLELGFETDGIERKQLRYVYDIDINSPNKWMRLRTNGEKTTLTIKVIVDKNSISGTTEYEIEVSDFNQTNEMLNILGFHHRNYQENMRQVFKKGNVEVSIDTWPLIPTYAEVEAKTELEVLETLKELGVDFGKVTTLDVNSIYNQIYGIDLLSIKELKFNTDNPSGVKNNESMLESD